MNKLLQILLFVLSFLFACNPAQNNSDTEASETTPSSNTTITTTAVYLPSITVEEMEYLWPNCNQIDYLFYDLPISSSIDNNPSAQMHLRHISDTPVNQATKSNCKQGLGRAFYKSSGEDIMEAEIFFTPQCAFFVFYKNGTPTYSNLMTQDGVNFYNQMVSAVQSAQTPSNGQ